MTRILIIIGILCILIGLLWPFIQKLGIGHLPGDIIIRKKNFTFYFPIVTSIIISIVVTIILWFFRK